MSKVDICDRLRLAPANLIGTDDEERYWVCHDAAREIERLRLTDEEREAIERDLSWLQWCEDNSQIGDVGRKDIATLRGLLERLG